MKHAWVRKSLLLLFHGAPGSSAQTGGVMPLEEQRLPTVRRHTAYGAEGFAGRGLIEAAAHLSIAAEATVTGRVSGSGIIALLPSISTIAIVSEGVVGETVFGYTERIALVKQCSNIVESLGVVALGRTVGKTDWRVETPEDDDELLMLVAAYF